MADELLQQEDVQQDAGPGPGDKVGKLYKTLSGKFNLGDESTFRSNMQDSAKRSKLYSAVSETFNIGSKNQFDGLFSMPKPKKETGFHVNLPSSAPIQDMPVSDATRTQFTISPEGSGVQSGAQLQVNKLKEMKANDDAARKNTALSRMKARGIPDSKENLDSSLAVVDQDIQNGNLSITHDKDGNPVYGRNASFLEGIETGFKENVASFINAAPLIWYGYINKDPKKLREVLEQGKAEQDMIRNNPQGLMAGATPFAVPKLNETGDEISYNSTAGTLGQMAGGMAPMIGAAALTGGGSAAVEGVASRGVGITPELIQSINPILAKTAVVGAESMGANISRVAQQLYDENTAENIKKGMSEDEAKDSAAKKAVEDAPLQAFAHSIPDALMFGGAASGGEAAKGFLETVDHAAKRTAGFGAVGGALETVNQVIRDVQGYKNDDPGSAVSNAALSWMGQAAAFELLPLLGKMPKFLQSEVKNYAVNNISKPVLDKVLSQVPNGADIMNQLDSWEHATGPLKGIIPPEKMASVGGVTERVNRLNDDIQALETQKSTSAAEAEMKKTTLPEALHSAVDRHVEQVNKKIDKNIADKKSEVYFANKQIESMLKSETPLEYEYDDATGQPVGKTSVVAPKENVVPEVTTPQGNREVQPEVATKSTKIVLPETNKTPERVEIKKQENVEKTEESVPEQPKTERVQPEEVTAESERDVAAEPEKQPVAEKKGGFSRFKDRKAAELETAKKAAEDAKGEAISEKEKGAILKQAASVEDNSPRGSVLSYFASGGKVSDAAMKEFFGDHQSEINSRLSIRSNKDGAKSIDALSHSLWENSPEEIRDNHTTQDFREAVEDVINSHNSRASMAKELVDRNAVTEEKAPKGHPGRSASTPDMFVEQAETQQLYDIHGKEIEGMPFQHKAREVNQDLADMKVAVKEQMDKGMTKLSDIQAVAKEELGDLSEYAEHPNKLRNLVEDAYHEVGKEFTPKEVTHGVIGAVSKFLDERFGGKGKKVAVLSNSESMMRKLNEFGNEPSLHLNEKGEILGFAHDGKIYLNAEHLNPNTTIHEAGHLWTDWAKEYRPDFYKKGMQLVAKSRYLKKVMENEFYQKEASRIGDPGSFKYEEYMKHEALAAAIGDKGAQFVTESTKGNFKKWLNALWSKVARVTGLDGISAARLQDMKFKDFTKGVAKDILSKGEKVEEVKPKEMAPAKEISKPEPEGKLFGISHERINKTAEELDVEPVPRGKTLTPEESVIRGRELLRKGVDPESVFDEKSPLSMADKVRVSRAHLEEMGLKFDRMSEAEQNSKEGIAFKKDYRDYMEATKQFGTEWSSVGKAMQGATDVEGNFLQISSDFKDAMGRYPNVEESAKIKELTSQVKELRKQVDAAEKKLIEQTNAAMESGEGGSVPAEKPKSRKFTEAAKKLANMFRKAKQKPFTFTDSNGNVIEIKKQGIGWNDMVEVGARVIEKTGEIADGVAAIIEKIKEEGFYAALSEKDKAAFGDQLHDYFEGEAVRLSPEARNIRRLERQLADLRSGKTSAKGEPRELSQKELDLKDEIAKEKEKLGLGRKEVTDTDKADRAIKRYEKQLDDLEKGVKKTYTDRGFEATPEQEARIEELKFKIKSRKEYLESLENVEKDGGLSAKTPQQQAISLQDLFADKVDNTFTHQEAKMVWDYMKSNYIEDGVSYRDAIVKAGSDLGLTFEQMNHAVVTPKTKLAADEVWKKNADLARGRESSKRYVQSQSRKGLLHTISKYTEIPRAIAVWGHAGVFVGTHAKRALLNPAYFVKVAKAFVNGYKAGYWPESVYEGMMNDLRSDPNYLIAQRSGLKNNPDDYHNLDSGLSTEHYFTNLGESKFGKTIKKINTSGERGFNAIKILRQDMFNYEYNRLPEEMKNDPEMLKLVSQMVNVSTGATNFKIPSWSNKLLFSAGLESNRWEAIIKQPLDAIKVLTHWKNSTPAQRYALKIYSRNMGSVFGVLLGALGINQGLNKLFAPDNKNFDINFTDPTKSTWLRFNVAGHVSDMTGGVASTLTFLSKLMKIAAVKDYENKRLPSMVDVATHYGRGKLSPFYSLVAEIVSRHDFSGNTVPWSNEKPEHSYNHKMSTGEYIVSHSMLPVAEASRTYFDNAEKQGVDHDVMSSVLGGILHFGLSGGVGITYYERGEDKKPASGRRKSTNRRKRRKKRE